MRLHRLGVARRASDLWSGVGGLHAAGRWTSQGRLVVYASESLALAQIEKLVQYRDRAQIPPQVAGTLDVPHDVQLLIVDPVTLPPDWRSPLQYPPALQALGDQWLRSGATLLFKVPSAVSPSEWNYLVDPQHPDFSRCTQSRPQPFAFDPRIR